MYHAKSNTESAGYEILLEKEKKVYHLLNDSFRLMYDFSLSKSDTFKTEIFGNSCDSVSPIVVDSIAVQKHGAVDIKTLYLSYTLFIKEEFGGSSEQRLDIIKERIGYEPQFIYYPSCSVTDLFTNTSLRCYQDPEVGTYRSSSWDYLYPNASCDSIIYQPTHNDRVPQMDSDMRLYPNPAGSTIHIQINSFIEGELQVISMLGTTVLSKPINESIAIDVNSLAPGIYYLRYQDESRTLIQRFQIIR
jgi:hypothetical protein